MAEATRTIELIFSAIDQASSVISGIGESASDFGQKLDAVATPIANFAESILKIEGAATLVGAAFVGLAIKGAVDFQSAVVDLQKVLDPADGDIRQFASAAIEISNKYGESSTQVLQSAADFKQAGFTASEAFNLAEVAIQALKITELQGGEAASDFIKILKGFDEPASSAARVLDILNEVSNVFAVDSAQLADALAKVAPIADQTGFSIEEITAVMTPAIEAFQDGDIVGRAFVTVLQRLVSDNKEVTDALKALGVAQFDANGQLRSGRDILNDVQIAYQTLDPSIKLVTATGLAGTEQAAKAILAFDGLAKTTDVLQVAMGATGSAAKELEVRMQAAQEQADRLFAIFDNVRILFGGTLLENFQKIEASGIKLGLVLQDMVSAGAFSGLTDLINAAEVEFAAFVDQLAAQLPTAFAQLDFSGLKVQLGALETAFNNLFGGIDLSSPEGLRQALQAIIDLGGDLIAFNTGLVKGFGLIKDAVELLLSPFGLAQAAAANLFGEIGAFAITYTLVSPLFSLLGDSYRLLHTSALLAETGVIALNTSLLASPIGIGLIATALAAGGVAFAAYKLSTDTASDALDDAAARQQKFIDASSPVSAELQRQALGFNQTTDSSAGFSQGLLGITGAMGALIGGFQEAAPAGSEFAGVIQAIAEENQTLIPGLSELDIAFSDFASTLKRQPITVDEAKQSVREYLESVGELGGVLPDATLASDLSTKGYQAQTIAVTDLETGTVSYTEALVFSGNAAQSATDKAAEGLSKTAKEALDAQKAANDFQLAWEKIQSDETIAFFRIQADVDIAAIQAGTEQIKAAFESVNTTIKSTGDTISSLVKSLTEVGTGSGAGQEILDLLEEENRRRQEALDLQKQLVEAQVAYLNAVIDRLSQGDAQISVTADGLEPELEAFMFKILERIQLRASSDAQQFLLGL